MPYSEWKDNEYIEHLVKELKDNGTNVVVGTLDNVINWGRSNSLWPLTFATSCCGIEFISLGAARYDMARFGWEVARASPRQADFMMVAGTIVHRMAPVVRRLYDQLAEPKYVIACVEEIIPVDVYVPGCPPRPEAMIYGIMQLSRKVKVEKFFGGVNRQEKQKEFLETHPLDETEK